MVVHHESGYPILCVDNLIVGGGEIWNLDVSLRNTKRCQPVELQGLAFEKVTKLKLNVLQLSSTFSKIFLFYLFFGGGGLTQIIKALDNF